MSDIVLYTKKNCPFSYNALNLCRSLRIPYKEYCIDGSHPDYLKIKQQLFNKFKHNSFPIVIIGSNVLGGFSELNNLYQTNQLYNLCKKHNIKIR
jgi:glutaredoxin